MLLKLTSILASDRKAVQKEVHMAQYITGVEIPAIQDLYIRRCQRKTLKIVKDSSHPSHRLLMILNDVGRDTYC
jgi:DNA polymerase phi